MPVILIVEDDAAWTEALLLILETYRPQWTTHCVQELAKAQEYLRTGAPIDAVILDLNLPDSRGLASLQTFLNTLPTVPVFVLTAIRELDLAQRAIEMSAIGFADKVAFARDPEQGLRIIDQYLVYYAAVLGGDPPHG